MDANRQPWVAAAVQKRDEINKLYWDFAWDETGRPVYAFEVEEIAATYGYSSGRSMRDDVDLRCHVQGVSCPDCGQMHVIRNRHELREYLDTNPRCNPCAVAVIQKAVEGRMRVDSHPMQPKKEPQVANVSTVLTGEAGIHTIRGGSEVELRLPPLPDGTEYPPMMKLLAAVVHRADEEVGWWEDQVRWYDAYMREKRFAKTRLQIKLVVDNATPKEGRPEPHPRR